MRESQAPELAQLSKSSLVLMVTGRRDAGDATSALPVAERNLAVWWETAGAIEQLYE